MYNDDISRLTKILKIQAKVIADRYNIDKSDVLADIQKDVIDAKFDRVTVTKKIIKVSEKTEKMTKRFLAFVSFFSFWNGIPDVIAFKVIRYQIDKLIERKEKNE